MPMIILPRLAPQPGTRHTARAPALSFEAELERQDQAILALRASNAMPSRTRSAKPFDGAAFAKSYGPAAFEAYLQAKSPAAPRPAEEPDRPPELTEIEKAQCRRDHVSPEGFAIMKNGGEAAYVEWLKAKR
jgi:hypothetical protein